MAEPRSEKKSQLDKFIANARELECDEDEDRFNATLKQIIKGGPKKGDKPAQD